MSYQLHVSDLGKETLTNMANQGFEIPLSTDVPMPILPSDITAVDNEELMELFTVFTAFLDFISYQVALAEIDERALERKLDAAVAVATANQPKGLAAVIKAAALADPKVVKISEEHEVAYNYRKLIHVMSDNLNRGLTLISRELTRRTADGHVMKRARKFTT